MYQFGNSIDDSKGSCLVTKGGGFAISEDGGF